MNAPRELPSSPETEAAEEEELSSPLGLVLVCFVLPMGALLLYALLT